MEDISDSAFFLHSTTIDQNAFCPKIFKEYLKSVPQMVLISRNGALIPNLPQNLTVEIQYCIETPPDMQLEKMHYSATMMSWTRAHMVSFFRVKRKGNCCPSRKYTNIKQNGPYKDFLESQPD